MRSFGDRFIQCKTADGISVNISGARTNEHLRDGDATAHWGLEHFGVNVDDIDAEIQRLKDLGAELMEGPIGVPNGPRIAFIRPRWTSGSSSFNSLHNLPLSEGGVRR